MSNLHRVQWLDIQIRNHRYPNCTQLAAEFCISRRQASRDVEYLRYSLGAPVEYSQEHNGYFYTDDSFLLPAVMISKEEKAALSYLAEQYKSVSGRMASQLAMLFTRLSGSKKEQLQEQYRIPVYAFSGSTLEVMRIIRDALEQKKKVKINYINAGNVQSERILRPYKYFIKNHIPYLVGFCEKNNEVRVFKVSRIREIILLGESYTIPVSFNPGIYNDQFQFQFRLAYTAVIRFNAPVQTAILDDSWQEIETCRYQVAFYESAQLFSRLFSLCREFTIESPLWLKHKFFKTVSAILEKNRP